MPADTVQLAIVFDDEQGYKPNWVRSLIPTLAVDRQVGRIIGWQEILTKGYDLPEKRNLGVKRFLESDADWLLWVDSDMGWDFDAVERLLAVADASERPIVGGLCFAYSNPRDVEATADGSAPSKFPSPTIYDLREGDKGWGFQPRYAYRPQALQQVDATGSAFILIHRGALERIADRFGEQWYTRMKHPDAVDTWSEDVSFCMRAKMCEIPVFVDTRVRTSHWKPTYVTETFYFERLQAPPADERVDVVVPVMGRPQHAERFMRSLVASTGLARVVAMANPGEDEVHDAWRAAGAEVVVQPSGRTTFAKKANDALEHLTADWFLLVGSDVFFRPAWWDHALQTGRVHGAGLVSTNDKANGDVRDGILAVHPVFRRSYVLEEGASWDGPGKVAHEGYRHWWVDAEWSLLARERGVFVFAQGAVVEHHHPQFGMAEMDDVYELGRKFRTYDKGVFEARAQRFTRKAAA